MSLALTLAIVDDLPAVPLAGANGAVLVAVVFEIVHGMLLARHTAGTRVWAAPGLLVFLVWSGHLTGLALADAVRWPVSLWSGAVIVCALLAAATGFATTQVDRAALR